MTLNIDRFFFYKIKNEGVRTEYKVQTKKWDNFMEEIKNGKVFKIIPKYNKNCFMGEIIYAKATNICLMKSGIKTKLKNKKPVYRLQFEVIN